VSARVRIVGAADGVTVTPHDGRFLVAWNPHTQAGTLELTSTADPRKAARLELAAILEQWRTRSRKQPSRPWDGRPNRPLTAVTIEIIPE
jgi:hypothetical protein